MVKQKATFMRIPQDLLKELKSEKLTPRQSYADVVKKLIEKERRLRK